MEEERDNNLPFKISGFIITIKDEDIEEEPLSEAIFKIRVGERLIHTVAEGNGPINAADVAIRKALEPVYPSLKTIELIDYQVKISNGRIGTDAKVEVLAVFSDGKNKWTSIGVSTDSVRAGVEALACGIKEAVLKIS
ncbi:MAG: alpha-isopropylmalate synthase regulatory domain-containing protein [Candidatus Pacebacteria bacterium]|nr:alpha-isopropylmalate synthase regulatory domain-containing protein [Candidatus Paceibacterota bacterium]